MNKENLIAFVVVVGLVAVIVWSGAQTIERRYSKEPELVVVPPLTLPAPQPPKERQVIPTYIKFYDLRVGESFTYNGKNYQKTASGYWTQPANPPINGNLWYPPGTFSPKPIQNARETGSGVPVHFEADVMVIWRS